MGTFNSSHVLSTWLKDAVSNAYTTSYRITADTIKLALFNATPDATIFPFDTLLHNVYNGAGGQWVVANEITGTNWAAGGVALGTLATAFAASGTADMRFSAANVSNASTTIATAFQGCLIYDNTTNTNANNGIVAVYFGGTYTVGGGTLAINWGNDGNAVACIFYITV